MPAGDQNHAAKRAYEAVSLPTSRGEVACRYYSLPVPRRAVVWVGGAGGGWDTPAHDLYPYLSEDLLVEGIASLRLRFRHSTLLDEAVFDVLAGLAFLTEQGVQRTAVVGHSFGGAVVIRAAARSPAVRTVVALATQAYGAERVRDLPDDCSILLAHGERDTVLPPYSSEYVHALAHEPKRLVLYEVGGHGLHEVAEDVHRLVREWLVEKLGIDAGSEHEEETMAEETGRHSEDLPLEPGGGDQREGRRVDQGSATGVPGVSGTQATDFRVETTDESRDEDEQ